MGVVKTVPSKVEAYRTALADMITASEPALFVTFAFNRTTSIEVAVQQVHAFHGRADRKLLTKQWVERPWLRSRYIAVIENADTNLHVHAAFQVRGCPKWFAACGPAIWTKLVPSGSLDIRPVTYAAGLGSYLAKQITPQTSERLIVSDFWLDQPQ